ncbi:MAG: Rne/Rng family ribonuclease [Candidatus Caldarchaeum sp.]
MNKEIIVNVTPRETRIAVLEDGQVMELRVEREERVVGSIYKGIVQQVRPGLDAAFVDIGLERNAFLYVADILPETDGEGETPASLKRSELRRRQIDELLRPGQELLVQVMKGPRGAKGARVSTRIALPGRYVVLLPEGDRSGVSRKVEDRKERERLKRVGERIRPQGFGLILRTECEGRTERELRADVKFLRATWDTIVETTKRVRAPACVYRDQTLLYRTVRDVLTDDVNRMVIDDPDEYQKVYAIAQMIMPGLCDRILLYDGEEPIFDSYAIEQQLEKLLQRKVWLKSGAYLVIDEMEAITAIDVNTGRHTGTSSLAETILNANLEAAEEVGRQLRLRDIGGIIVVDFIDMANPADKRKLMEHFQEVLKRDRARTRVGRLSSLGLVELTRKRTEVSVTEALTEACPVCEGTGRVPSPETVSLWIERDLKRRLREPGNAFFIQCHPSVCEELIGLEGENVERLEHQFRRGLYVRGSPELGIEEYIITAGTIEDFDKKLMNFRRAQVVECLVEESSLSGGPRLVGWTENGYYTELSMPNGEVRPGEKVKVCLDDIRRSFAVASVIQTGISREIP